MKLRMGTRASGFARAQSAVVMDLIRDQAAALGVTVVDSVVPVTAETDALHGAEDEPLDVFMGALRVALLSGDCDLLVHSVGDIWHSPHPDLRLAATVPRRDPRDAILTGGPSFADLAPGARVAVRGARRVAQLLALRPDLTPVESHGSMTSRIERLTGGDVEALVVPRAHLDALGVSYSGVHDFSLEEMLPGPGDAVLVVEVRADAPDDLVEILESLNDPGPRAAAEAECAAAEALDPTGTAAIGTYGVMDGGMLHLQVRVLSPRGTLVLNDFSYGPPEDATRLGRHAALALVGRGARKVLSADG